MPISHLLADFTAVPSGETRSCVISEESLEDHRLAAFEKGYAAGWEDALIAQGKDQAGVSAALSQSLEDFSFTYHEAKDQLMASLEPLFSTLVTSVLPQTLMEVLGHRIVEQIMDLSRDQLEQSAVITVAAGESAGLAALIPRDPAMPVTVKDDPTLGPGMALVKLGGQEREIDCTTFTETLQGTVKAFFHQHGKETRNG